MRQRAYVAVLYSDPNDPQTGNDPQIGPQMIRSRPANDPRRKITNSMDFGFLDFFKYYLQFVSGCC